MKISYILQFKNFCIILILGVIIGAIYGIIASPLALKKNIVYKIIVEGIISIFASVLFIYTQLTINLGEFRFYFLVGYLLGIIIERLTLGKLFAKGYKSVYNKLIFLIQKIKDTKFGRVIFK